jgi:N-acetylmuramoyl-L-alanine amidase
MKTLLATLMIALLAGCATPGGPRIDTSLTAKAQSSRVKFIVIHYTVSNLPQSIKILTEQVVSSHYLLTDQPEPIIYNLVDETRQANHAGVSNWKNYTLLNSSSIGIEIVNPGFTTDANGVRTWYPFPQAQMDQLILLLKQIVAKHHVPPENILGHSDIAPGRKQDPGPMFPWFQLAQAGLIQWPEASRVIAARPQYDQQLPDAAWFQKRLAQFGYATPQTGELDTATKNVITSFQMKYRPAIIDGTPDAETAALLDVLTTKAVPAAVPAPAPVEPATPVAPAEAPAATAPEPAKPL